MADDVGLNRRGLPKSMAGPAAEFLAPSECVFSSSTSNMIVFADLLGMFMPRAPLEFKPPLKYDKEAVDQSRLEPVAELVEQVGFVWSFAPRRVT